MLVSGRVLSRKLTLQTWSHRPRKIMKTSMTRGFNKMCVFGGCVALKVRYIPPPHIFIGTTHLKKQPPQKKHGLFTGVLKKSSFAYYRGLLYFLGVCSIHWSRFSRGRTNTTSKWSIFLLRPGRYGNDPLIRWQPVWISVSPTFRGMEFFQLLWCACCPPSSQ